MALSRVISGNLMKTNLRNFIPQLRAEMGYPSARIIQHRIQASQSNFIVLVAD